MSTRELAKLIEELPAEAREQIERYAKELRAKKTAGDTRAAKLAQMAKAANDPLYLSDMEEIAKDFAAVDSE